MPADILPGFAWGRSVSRYRDLSTGRFVARSDIVSLLDSQVAKLENRLASLTTAAVEGKLSPAYFAEQMRTELRRSHLAARAVGVGGIDKLDSADYGAIGRRLRDDYSRIADLTKGIRDKTISLPQALNRVQGYAGNARLEFFEGDREAAREAAKLRGTELVERRLLGISEHCVDCVHYAEMSWQPIGVLPPPGSGSICSTHCRCSMERREVTAQEAAQGNLA